MSTVKIYPKYFKNAKSTDGQVEQDLAIFAINWEYPWKNSGKTPSTLSFKGVNEVA